MANVSEWQQFPKTGEGWRTIRHPSPLLGTLRSGAETLAAEHHLAAGGAAAGALLGGDVALLLPAQVLGEGGDGGIAEEVHDGDFPVEEGAELLVDLDGEEGVAAEVEEVVRGADLVH